MSKNKGKFLAVAVIAGVVAAGVSYLLQYKAFNKDADDDFHGFEDEDEDFDDFEEDDSSYEEDEQVDVSAERNYVSINPVKTEEENKESADEKTADDSESTMTVEEG